MCAALWAIASGIWVLVFLILCGCNTCCIIVWVGCHSKCVGGWHVHRFDNNLVCDNFTSKNILCSTASHTTSTSLILYILAVVAYIIICPNWVVEAHPRVLLLGVVTACRVDIKT